MEKDELFEESDPLHGETFDVGKLSVGYVYAIPVGERVSFGLDGLGSVYHYSGRLQPNYDDNPVS